MLQLSIAIAVLELVIIVLLVLVLRSQKALTPELNYPICTTCGMAIIGKLMRRGSDRKICCEGCVNS